MNMSRHIEGLLKDHGDEAFRTHKEEIYAAVKTVCFCAEFLQNQEDWGSRRAIVLRKAYTTKEYWKKECQKKYDGELRKEEIRKLIAELGNQRSWADEEIPLKNFLRQGLLFMAEEAPDAWMELMETNIMVNQYADYRAFQAGIYVLGLWELMKFREGIYYHNFEGDFRDAELLLKSLRSRIPEKEREDYDRYCAGLLRELEKDRIGRMKQILEERERRLETKQKREGEIPIVWLFQKKMEAMDDKEFEAFIEERLIEEEWEDYEEFTPEANLRAKKMSRIENLLEFVYGGSGLRKRLFQYLSEEEQTILMERWMPIFYPPTVEALAGILKAMFEVVDPDHLYRFDEKSRAFYEKCIQESLEKIAGRTFIKGYEYLI